MRLLSTVFSEYFFKDQIRPQWKQRNAKKMSQKQQFACVLQKIVSIDATQKTNQYNFPLINLISPDEF